MIQTLNFSRGITRAIATVSDLHQKPCDHNVYLAKPLANLTKPSKMVMVTFFCGNFYRQEFNEDDLPDDGGTDRNSWQLMDASHVTDYLLDCLSSLPHGEQSFPETETETEIRS